MPKRKRTRKAGSSRLPGGSSRLPGGALRAYTKRSRPANQGKHRPVVRKAASNYLHGSHFVGGSLSKHDGIRVFQGAQNTYYPAMNRALRRHIDYKGLKHTFVRGNTI